MINMKKQKWFQSNMTNSIPHRLNIYKTCKRFRTSNNSIKFKIIKLIKDVLRIKDLILNQILLTNSKSFKVLNNNKMKENLKESLDTRES